MSETLLEMTKDLVLAQIQARQVTADTLAAALASTYRTLSELASAGAARGEAGLELAAAEPGSWRHSIRKHTIECLVCGESFKQLSRRHLQRHGLDSRSYRQRYGIPSEQPLSARAATARRREVAMALRPWERAAAKRGAGVAEPEAELAASIGGEAAAPKAAAKRRKRGSEPA